MAPTPFNEVNESNSWLGSGDESQTALLEPGTATEQDANRWELGDGGAWSENPMCDIDDDLDDDEAYFLDDEDDDDDDFSDDYDDDEFEDEELEDDSDDETDDEDL